MDIELNRYCMISMATHSVSLLIFEQPHHQNTTEHNRRMWSNPVFLCCGNIITWRFLIQKAHVIRNCCSFQYSNVLYKVIWLLKSWILNCVEQNLCKESKEERYMDGITILKLASWCGLDWMGLK